MNENILTKMNQTDTQILIVGGGLTGLTLACDLLRRNVDFRIIDKLERPFPGSRGNDLQPRTLEVLDDLGVIEQIIPYGRFHLLTRQYEGASIIKDVDSFEGLYPTPNTPYASTLYIPQFEIERILREKLSEQGKYVEWATELISFEQDENMVTATVYKNGSTLKIESLFMIASDGGRSFVRKHLKLGFFGETLGGIKMLAGDVRTDDLDHEHTHMWSQHPDGFIALTPFPKTEIFQFQAQVSSDFQSDPTIELFQQILLERTGLTIKLSNPTWLSSFKINNRMVDQAVLGRICIAGDAAHVHSPAGGQGMNTGMQDAYNLGWKLGLILRGSNIKLLDTYQEERLPVAASVLGLSIKLLDKLVKSDKTEPVITERFQLSLNYRTSRLSKQATCLELLLMAGDRAPDAILQDNSGDNIRLFDLFRGPHFTLLLTGNIKMDELTYIMKKRLDVRLYYINLSPFLDFEHADYFIDVKGNYGSAYGTAQNMIYLVRPDGYIGFIGDDTQVKGLILYIEQLLAP